MIFDRTFHPDEANQAFTVGTLLETGTYAYRSEDAHGPTLYYAAAPLQKAFGHATTATLDGNLLRLTPLLFAVLALSCGFAAVYRLMRAHAVGPQAQSAPPHDRRRAAAVAALFTVLMGTVPLFVFFATDFIQEMLLLSFTVGMFLAAVSHKPWWFGLAAGLALSTKETSVLTFAAALTAWAAAFPRKLNANKILLAALVAALTAVTLYSSFCADFHGVYEAFVAAPLSYFRRGTGSALSTGAAWHVHPFAQYVRWLGATWCLLLPALPGVVALVVRRKRRVPPQPAAPDARARFFVFALVYTAVLFALYSALPYKTPWCALQFVPGLCLAAVTGAAVFVETFAGYGRMRLLARPLALALCAVPIAVHLPVLAHINAQPDDHALAFNYAGASPEVKKLAALVEEALAHPCAEPFAAVILPACDTWPFPWYNRAREGQTGYWTDPAALEDLAGRGTRPSVILVPMTEGHRVQPLFPYLKHTRRLYMRPGVRIRIFW